MMGNVAKCWSVRRAVTATCILTSVFRGSWRFPNDCEIPRCYGSQCRTQRCRISQGPNSTELGLLCSWDLLAASLWHDLLCRLLNVTTKFLRFVPRQYFRARLTTLKPTTEAPKPAVSCGTVSHCEVYTGREKASVPRMAYMCIEATIFIRVHATRAVVTAKARSRSPCTSPSGCANGAASYR